MAERSWCRRLAGLRACSCRGAPRFTRAPLRTRPGYGKSVATELVRQGYVVIAIDMFYWGERRMLLADDPPAYRGREKMTREEIEAWEWIQRWV